MFDPIEPPSGIRCSIAMSERRVVVTGGTGLVGRQVVEVLLGRGWEVVVLSRSAKSSDRTGLQYGVWDGRSGAGLEEAFRGAKAVVHLAGENVSQRWTRRAKDAILNSRIEGGTAVRDAIESLPESERPALVAASAIGWYASSSEWQDERTPAGPSGFLAEVVKAWEGVFNGIATRHVTLRIGVVLSRKGGALAQLEPLFKWGFGSAVGSGNQWQSWIHVEDLARLFADAVEQAQWEGVYNAVAPNPVTNRELSAALAKTMGKPFWAPAPPAFVMKAVLGEMSAIVLDSQRIRSTRLNGDDFKFPELAEALADLYAS